MGDMEDRIKHHLINNEVRHRELVFKGEKVCDVHTRFKRCGVGAYGKNYCEAVFDLVDGIKAHIEDGRIGLEELDEAYLSTGIGKGPGCGLEDT